MAKKTVNRKSSSHITSRSIDRQILSYSDDSKAIHYVYENNEEGTLPTITDSPTVTSTPHPIPTQASTTPPSPNGVSGGSSRQVMPLADVSLSATDVVLAITAHKLKRPFDEVTLGKSLRDLSGGESRHMPIFLTW